MKIAILGGGISGLSAAWHLKKQCSHAKIFLLEASSRLGGVIQTVNHAGSLFEKGPRTFAVSRSLHLLRLIEELGLKEEILYSNPSSSKRYLWNRGSLRSMQAFLPSILLALVKEAFCAKKQVGDESIYEYCIRRLNRHIAETLFDPLTLGIYSGDIKKLSLRSCFPFLHEWESNHRSIYKALFQKKKDHRLFTLRFGIQSLIEALVKQLDIEFVLNCPVEKITKEGVEAGGKFWKVDRIVSALPPPSLGKLTQLWPDFPTNSLWVVNLGFSQNILPKDGFGYLVPTKEREAVMGMVWDSSIFPRSDTSFSTILTAMVRNHGDESWVRFQVLKGLQKHLGCSESPAFYESYLAENAIPQFIVGYQTRLTHFQSELKKNYPSLRLTGNYLNGVSVDACIQASFQINL